LKLIYENPVIGVITQRIGECVFSNLLYTIAPEVLLSQQSPLEKRFRDFALSVGCKVIVVEFKSPELHDNSLLFLIMTARIILLVWISVVYWYFYSLVVLDVVWLLCFLSFLETNYWMAWLPCCCNMFTTRASMECFFVVFL